MFLNMFEPEVYECPNCRTNIIGRKRVYDNGRIFCSKKCADQYYLRIMNGDIGYAEAEETEMFAPWFTREEPDNVPM